MKDRIHHVWREHLDEEGEPQWPEARARRDELASRLLGACVVSAMDGAVDDALDTVHRKQTATWRRDNGGPDVWKRDRAKRALFEAMSPEQRAAVDRIVVDAVFSTMFHLLVKIDRFPSGEDAIADIVVKRRETGEAIASMGDGNVFDFHDRLFTWLEEMSEHHARFIDRN